MLSTLPETGNLPAVYVYRAQIVEEKFWAKLLKLAGRVPFVEDLAAAYFCLCRSHHARAVCAAWCWQR